MYSVAIMNNGYPEWFFLLELRRQCGLAKYAYSRLVEYSRTEIAIAPPDAPVFTTKTSVEITKEEARKASKLAPSPDFL
jgi:hypothetical protein